MVNAPSGLCNAHRRHLIRGAGRTLPGNIRVGTLPRPVNTCYSCILSGSNVPVGSGLVKSNNHAGSCKMVRNNRFSASFLLVGRNRCVRHNTSSYSKVDTTTRRLHQVLTGGSLATDLIRYRRTFHAGALFRFKSRVPVTGRMLRTRDRIIRRVVSGNGSLFTSSTHSLGNVLVTNNDTRTVRTVASRV